MTNGISKRTIIDGRTSSEILHFHELFQNHGKSWDKERFENTIHAEEKHDKQKK